MRVFDDQIIGVFQSSPSSIKGMFYYLNYVINQSSFEYSIKGAPKSPFTTNYIDKINSNAYYFSEDDCLSLNFTFSSPIFVTRYAIMNASPNNGNTYPKSWKLYGVDSRDSMYLIDSREDQNFAYGSKEVVKAYSTRARRAFSKYVWLQTNNSHNNKYVYIKHFDFFGTICGITGDCNLSKFFRTCKLNKCGRSPSSLYLLIMILAL